MLGVRFDKTSYFLLDFLLQFLHYQTSKNPIEFERFDTHTCPTSECSHKLAWWITKSSSSMKHEEVNMHCRMQFAVVARFKLREALM